MTIDQKLLLQLSHNEPSLTHVNLSCQGLTDTDITDLIAALENNTTLTRLNVSGNQIGDKGAAALAKNTILTTLDVSYNQIGDEGARARPEHHAHHAGCQW